MSHLGDLALLTVVTAMNAGLWRAWNNEKLLGRMLELQPISGARPSRRPAVLASILWGGLILEFGMLSVAGVDFASTVGEPGRDILEWSGNASFGLTGLAAIVTVSLRWTGRPKVLIPPRLRPCAQLTESNLGEELSRKFPGASSRFVQECGASDYTADRTVGVFWDDVVEPTLKSNDSERLWQVFGFIEEALSSTDPELQRAMERRVVNRLHGHGGLTATFAGRRLKAAMPALRADDSPPTSA